ncbi:ribulose-phosphate 3-epimerase [Candidatus Bipolaricaulota bacterium]
MKLSPSLLSADFSKLREEAASVEALVDRFHWDVMDGHFVPNLTFGPPVVNSLRSVLTRPFDIHLMIDHPAEYAPQFDVHADDTITFHIETADSPDDVFRAMAATGARAGIALRPSSSVGNVEPYLERISYLLVMSVEPGFGGQAFMPEAFVRIRELRRLIGDLPIEIAVDGGIHAGNIADVVSAGADIIVAGSAVFGAADRAEAIRGLREAAS